jgi:transcriptional/translational regulatory protein YebC/TACO1
VPSVKVNLDFDTAKKVIKLIDALDDLDDVQNIYSNWTASPEVLQLLEDEE